MTDNKLVEAVRIFIGCAYPVATEIDPRGYRWSQAYLDQALPIARAALASHPVPSAPEPKLPPRMVRPNTPAPREWTAIYADGKADGWNAGRDANAAPASAPEPSEPPEVTDEMVNAYLTANDDYWRKTDELPTPADKWRTGTAREATRVSLIAALSEQRKGACPVCGCEELDSRDLWTCRCPAAPAPATPMRGAPDLSASGRVCDAAERLLMECRISDVNGGREDQFRQDIEMVANAVLAAPQTDDPLALSNSSSEGWPDSWGEPAADHPKQEKRNA